MTRTNWCLCVISLVVLAIACWLNYVGWTSTHVESINDHMLASAVANTVAAQLIAFSILYFTMWGREAREVCSDTRYIFSGLAAAGVIAAAATVYLISLNLGYSFLSGLGGIVLFTLVGFLERMTRPRTGARLN